MINYLLRVMSLLAILRGTYRYSLGYIVQRYCYCKNESVFDGF
jgi:hypothetical protein